MEMRPIDDIDIGRDLTPSLSPLAFSLYDSSLLSHCSACFSPLSPPPHQFSPLLPSSPINSHHAPNPSIFYCSPQCSNSDSDLHVSSAEHHLHLPHQQSHPTSCPLGGDTSDVRVALRLLHLFDKFHLISRPNERRLERIGGLMSNRDKLMSIENEEDGDIPAKIRNGARVMVSARRMRDGLDLDFSGDCLLEEAVLCLVLTNAVEVQVNGGRAIGIAVYDTTFSWINHSCSPNACYRFSLQENYQGSGDSPLWITPAATNTFDEIEAIHYGVCNKGGLEYGPRVILRSIKAIKKSEEVSIAYTDLLQPKAMRQLELWLKYRFICCCRRCDTWPPTYVDHCLQEISAVNLDCTNLSSDHNFYRDEAIRMLIDYVDDATSEYISFGNPESCCEKLENLLTRGLPDEQSEPKENKSLQIFRLHPLHHLSLNAYTILASAYKIRASDLLAPNPDMREHQLEAFNMSRTSSAYSLLLAGATHHLFLYESSLIASLANFWTSTGESLLSLARSPVWNFLVKCSLIVSELSSFPSHKFCKCALTHKFEANFVGSHDQNGDFEERSREFLDCIKNITPRVWSFLAQKDCYLKAMKDPIDFRWIRSVKDFKILDCEAHVGSSDMERIVSRCEVQGCAHEERINIVQVGVHCLLYGGFLSSICYGQHSYDSHYIQNLLHSKDNLIDKYVK